MVLLIHIQQDGDVLNNLETKGGTDMTETERGATETTGGGIQGGSVPGIHGMTRIIIVGSQGQNLDHGQGQNPKRGLSVCLLISG